MTNAIKWVVVCVTLSVALIANGREACHSPDSSHLYGQWRFAKFIHEGQIRPPLNPDLILTFEFNANGTSRLHWQRKGEDGFCERFGSFTFNDCQLVDRVTWVNPGNMPECGRDPDMQLGSIAATRADVIEGEFYLFLTLGGEPFTYIWEPIDSCGVQQSEGGFCE